MTTETVHRALLAILFLLPALPSQAGEVAVKPSFEEYLRQSAVTREVIDGFLHGPSWAQFDPGLGYILGNYLPSDGIDRSTRSPPSRPNNRTSFMYAGRKCRIML